ncbi:MAG: ATP-binding protein [Prevotellaceae bacterium]|nr:ATP-binding protein [Candidatus Colivivens caballi]
MERKYLEGIGDSEVNPLFQLAEVKGTPKSPVSWIGITQVGKPLKDDAEFCFTAMQKILYSCFLPQSAQLLFLVTNDGISNKMYIGVRPLNSTIDKRFAKHLSDFMKGQWPGLKCDVITDQEQNRLRNYASQSYVSGKTDNVSAITGIPSMESQYKTIYPATIDQLLAGMNGCKNFAYLVVADPIDNSEVDSMLYQCREMNGQAESLKSFNISEGKTEGLSRSITEGSNWSHSDGTNSSKSGKDWEGAWNKIKGSAGLGLAVGGIAVAASVAFPPAAATMGAIASSIGANGMIAAGSTLIGLMGNKSVGESHSDSFGGSRSVTDGMSESQSQTISHNVVNKHIEAVSEHLFYQSKRIETGKAVGMWKVGAYLITSKESDSKSGTMQLRSILSGQESVFEPIRTIDITEHLHIEDSFARLQTPNIYIRTNGGNNFEHPLGNNYKELKTVLTTKELSYLVNFPLRSVPGISVVDSTPEFSLNKPTMEGTNIANFGKLLYGGSSTSIDYELSIDSLSKHTLLSGINGTGKTNTVQAILNSVKNKMPFLIIEPAKTEYVDWAIEHNKKFPNERIDIYIPGCKKYRGSFVPKPLRINPFEIVWLNSQQEPNVLTHIDRLKSTFAAAFPMYDILPVLMEDLIYTVYQNKSTDWLSQEPRYGHTLPPTLNSMSTSVDRVIGNRQYEERIERNMKACLNTRIDSLKRGWKGDMLNVVHSTPWDELFGRPCVINLSYVGDDVDKSFFMALILQLLYEFRTAQAEIGQIDFNGNICKHLTVIEEAHRVMMKCENPELPQYKSAMMFSNMLSEIRAYGEGMFLVDQVPTRLIPDAIKNTNTKITHRLVSEDDCKAIAESMGINKEQRLIIPKLRVGQCIVSTSLSTDKHWVQVNKVK